MMNRVFNEYVAAVCAEADVTVIMDVPDLKRPWAHGWLKIAQMCPRLLVLL